MRRPEWAAAGTFADAWRGAVSQAVSILEAGDILRYLADARVIAIEREQVDALPYLPVKDAGAYALESRCPFPTVYLSLGDFEAGPVRFAGALLMTSFEDARVIADRISIAPFLRTAGMSEAVPIGVARPNRSEESDKAFRMFMFPELVRSDRDGEFFRDALMLGAQRAMDVLYFLESANVDLVEARPSRQERRAVQRKGGRVALTVAIRQPKRRPTHGTGGHIEFSHRFEVRGHYKHFPEGTKLADADPAKLSYVPERGGFCRKIWCPPFVKGPEDRPLVPKVRVVA